MKRFFLFFFLLAPTAVPAALHYLCKPLIVLSLLGYYRTATTHTSGAVLAALALSWLGDVLLLFQDHGPGFFIGGLLAFLTAHLGYLAAYRAHRWPGPGLPVVRRVLLALPVLAAGTALLTVLVPHLGPLRGPVVVYAAMLVLMVLSALYRAGRTSAGSFGWVAAGAMLFMVSDSLLALNKFLTPLPGAGFGIMLTYCAAQYGLVRGLLAHPRAPRLATA